MEPVHRLFFAIRPPEGAHPYFLEEQRRFGPGRAVREDYLHLTTVISNDYRVFPRVVAQKMLVIGDSVVADRFPVVLDQVVATRHSVAMCSSERLRSFDTLYDVLALGMTRTEVPIRAGWRSRPHATLLYRCGEPLRQCIDPMSWMVTEFLLIHSLVGFGRHEVLCRWSLQAPVFPTLH
jgi:2'-5' RNA ligase